MLDLTEGSILRKIILFALPIIGGNMLQQLYNVTDTLIVGKTLGVLRLAAVGACGATYFLMFGFILGLTSGCAVIISQAFGAKDMSGVRRAIAAHIIIATMFALIMTIVFLLAVKPVLTLMRTTADTIGLATAYITIIYQGITVTMLYNLLAASLRAVGDSKTPLKFLLFSSLLNIALDLLFIIKFHWDVQGAARATVLAQFVSALLCIIYLCRKMPSLIPGRESWKNLTPVVFRELRVGIPLGLQYTIISLGMMILQSVVNDFGSNAVAAVTVGNKMHQLMIIPLSAMVVAMSTFVAQNLGAKKHDRIVIGVKKCAIFTFTMACIIGIVMFTSRDAIIEVFIAGHQPEVMSYARKFLTWESLGIPLISFLFVYRGAVQGLGGGTVVMLAGLLELGMRLVASVIGSPILGFIAVCMAGPLAWTAGALVQITYFYLQVNRRKTIEKA